jgi:LysR family glycine cleavage system transcriptional activator
VTPSAVSHRIRALEEELGQALFRRLARGLVLTEAGRAFQAGVADGFERLARATRAARTAAPAGRVVVSVLPSFASGWLAPRLSGFLARCPEIDLVVRSERHLVDFALEDADLAVRYGLDGGFGPLLATRLTGEDIFPVCSPALLNGPRPLRRFADLARHVLIHDDAPGPSEPWITWEPWLREAGLDGPESARGPRFSDTAMLYQAAARGLGVALGRGALVGDELASGRLVRPFEASRRSVCAYYAVCPPAHAADPRVAAVVDWLLEEAARSPAV